MVVGAPPGRRVCWKKESAKCAEIPFLQIEARRNIVQKNVMQRHERKNVQIGIKGRKQKEKSRKRLKRKSRKQNIPGNLLNTMMKQSRWGLHMDNI